MNSKEEYIIDEASQGIRLDKAVVTLDTEISRVMVQRLIEDGSIKVNRKNCKALI